MQPFSIGLSAMTASERALALIGQNIANANTPGYHRQALDLSARILGGTVGAGVDVEGVKRFRDGLLENSLTVGRYQAGKLDGELPVYRQLEGLLSPGPGTLTDLTDRLFSEAQKLAQAPDDNGQRRVLVDTAGNLAHELNDLAQEFTQMRADLRDRVEGGIEQVNSFAAQIADYNRQLAIAERTGQPSNELADKRDHLVNQLADLIDVRVIPQPYGVVNILAGGAPLVVGTTPATLVSGSDASGLSIISMQGTTTPLNVTGGKVGAWSAAHNDILTNYEPRVDAFANELASRLDSVQATGLPLGGPQTAALGSRPTSSATAPLATTTQLPVQAGSIWLSVTDQATGQRTLTEVVVDPATDSLQSLAGAITTASGGQVQGSAAAGNRLQLQAQAGYAFDFAGRIPSSPTNLAMNGTAVPAVNGIYTGASDGDYSFAITGSGTIGSTPGLLLEVRDTTGNVIGSHNVGQGYTPGSTIPVGEGLSLKLGAGTTNNGTFDVPVVSQPDSTGLLAALGVSTLFTGNGASGLRVRPEITADPSLLAASRDGNPGDPSNLARLVALGTEKVLGGGTETFSDNLGNLVGDAGADVRSRSDQQTALTALQAEMFAQQQGLSGVDPNEELTTMLVFQRSFQVAAKFIATVNVTMDSLLDLVQ